MPSFLAPDDPAAFVQEGLTRPGRFFVTIEHAGRAIPRQLGDLGLRAADRERHIFSDLGADPLGSALAQLLDAPLHKSSYSRLVIDVNRDPDHPEAMPALADGTRVPANENLSQAARKQRIEALFTPYHEALDKALAARQQPLLVFVHSMTPALASQPTAAPRLPVTVLHNADIRLAEPLLARIRASGIETAANEPYSGFDHTAYTLHLHGLSQNRPHVAIEVRQDLLHDSAGQQLWATRLADWLDGAARDAALL